MVNGGIGMINDWLFQKKKGAKLFIINIGCTVIHQPESTLCWDGSLYLSSFTVYPHSNDRYNYHQLPSWE